MVSPIVFEALPGTLRGVELRNWLRTDGAGLFRLFDTTDAALTYARELGLQIRTQDFYAIANQVKSLWDAGDKISGYSSNQLIPLAWHDKEHGLELSSAYQYRIQLFGSDPETGYLTARWMTVASDRQLSKDMVKEVAMSYVGEGGQSGEVEDIKFGDIQPLRR